MLLYNIHDHADNGVGCVAGEAGAGAMVGGAAVVADEQPDVGSNRADAASAGDSLLVSGVLTGSECRCWHACNRFVDVAVVKPTSLVGGSSGSATSQLDSSSPEQGRREACCLAGTGGGSCSRRGTFEL